MKDQEIRKFIERERVCVLSGIMTDGGSHSSTVHFSHEFEPFKLYFQTWKDSMKNKALVGGADPRASAVIGVSENQNITLQMRGGLRIVADRVELNHIHKIHFDKHPFAKKYLTDETVFIEFTPLWWRYSDFNSEPETRIEGQIAKRTMKQR